MGFFVQVNKSCVKVYVTGYWLLIARYFNNSTPCSIQFQD